MEGETSERKRSDRETSIVPVVASRSKDERVKEASVRSVSISPVITSNIMSQVRFPPTLIQKSY